MRQLQDQIITIENKTQTVTTILLDNFIIDFIEK